ncbi:MAG: ECF transporter S component [Bacillota bacterium]|nr:ECF transporter S component [Bacillota bacterium]
MKTITRKITVTGILIALSLAMGFTVGYLPISIGPLQITLMHIPVIVGTIMEGLVPGLILGLVFGFTSMMQLFMGSPFIAVFNVSPVFILMIIFIPRLLIPVFTWLVNKAITGKSTSYPRHGIAAGVAALTGSLTNTVFFLGMMYFLVGGILTQIPQIAAIGVMAFITGTALVNGLPEAAAAVLLTVPIVLALKRAYKSRFMLVKPSEA